MELYDSQKKDIESFVRYELDRLKKLGVRRADIQFKAIVVPNIDRSRKYQRCIRVLSSVVFNEAYDAFDPNVDSDNTCLAGAYTVFSTETEGVGNVHEIKRAVQEYIASLPIHLYDFSDEPIDVLWWSKEKNYTKHITATEKGEVEWPTHTSK